MRLQLRALCLSSLLAVGCARYQDDPVFAYGRVLNADGSPRTGELLTIERTPHNSRQFEHPYDKPSFFPYGTVTTDAYGDFIQEAPQGEVYWFDEGRMEVKEYRFRVGVTWEDGGGAFVSFWHNDDVELPTLQSWDARLALSPAADGHLLTFEPPPPPPATPVSAEILTTSLSNRETGITVTVPLPPTTPEPVLEVTSQAETVFRTWNVTSPRALTRYVLEDFATPELRLRAMSLGEWWFYPLASIDSALHFRVEWYSAPLRFPTSTLRPVSRGAPCQPSPRPECPWTDGKLAPVAVSPAAPEIRLTLAEPARLKHAVLRGLEKGRQARLEGSVDGETWVLLGETDSSLPRPDFIDEPVAWATEANLRSTEGPTGQDHPFLPPLHKYVGAVYAETPLADVGPVRYVRLMAISRSSPDSPVFVQGVIHSLAEVSLFE